MQANSISEASKQQNKVYKGNGAALMLRSYLQPPVAEPVGHGTLAIFEHAVEGFAIASRHQKLRHGTPGLLQLLFCHKWLD